MNKALYQREDIDRYVIQEKKEEGNLTAFRIALKHQYKKSKNL